jgi:hypothetical protein
MAIATPKQVAAVRPLLELIYKAESGNNYNAVNRGKAGDTRNWQTANHKKVSDLSISEVQALQAAEELFAVGAVQIIPETLKMLATELRLSGKEQFSPETQDLITTQLLIGRKRPQLRDYLLGVVSGGNALDRAIDDLAYEWASMPNSKGKGWYDGDTAGNKAHGTVEAVRAAIIASRSALAAAKLEAALDASDPPAASDAAPAAPAPKKAPVLYRMVATQATWLKKAPVQASDLKDNQKVAVAAGKAYAVVAHREIAAQGHAEVELGDGAGTWVIYEAHWSRPGTTVPPVKAPTFAVAPAHSINWGDFGFQITPVLTVGEVLQWDSRRRPPANSADIRRILQTAEQHMAIRQHWGGPLGVTSYYRPEPINREVGGVPGSWHISGDAMDIYPVRGSLEQLYQYLMQRWTGGLGDGRHRGFIHLDREGGGHFVPGGGVRPRRWWTY